MLKARSHALLALALFTCSSLIVPAAWSKPQMNAMCYMEDKPKATVQGLKTKEPFEIASVSKIITSFWALKNLGPQHRFKTRVTVNEVGDGIYDVHVTGARDPFFGRDMSYFLLSELYRLNIRTIRELSFDQNFILNWGVREHPSTNVLPNPDRVEATLRERLKFNARDYTNARTTAANLGISLEAAPRVSIAKIRFVAATEYSAATGAKTLELASAPLYKYLKEMNRVSNNYVADQLFQLLGGSAEFQTFIKKQLGFDAADIHFLNGSGDSVKVTLGEGKIKKVYNEASCDVLVHVLDSMRDLLRKQGLDLENIMAVAGRDARSTLSGRYSAAGVSGAMVAKTGTVDPAVTLAGMISTEQGDVYFGILYHTNGPGDWSRGKDAIRAQVVGLMTKYGGKDDISYQTAAAFLPFDRGSRLCEPEPEVKSSTTLQ
jgi:D-alanyl-D-alanine carboxypeptidase